MDAGVDCTGHEGAGVVAAVGPNAGSWKVGDRVGITPVAHTCEKCDICLSGRELEEEES
jgi:D-arabinose 1-dehydrogenase-like Zn-dependent alcohol dehydrogenase